MIVHDCTRQAEVLAFIQCESPALRSGWFLDRYFRERRTRAELLEIRRYSEMNVPPLFYVGACQPPNVVQGPAETLNVMTLNWPTIKAEASITGCNVDERRINPDGTIVPVGIERFNAAFNWEMRGVIEGLRATHIREAVTLLRTGGYVVRSKDGPLGTIDFQRKATLKGLDLSDTDGDWANVCTNPFTAIETILSEMSQCGGVGGGIDVIFGATAWAAVEAYLYRSRATIGGILTGTMDPSRSLFSQGQTLFGFDGYTDTQYRGTSNDGRVRFWTSSAKYVDYDGNAVDVVKPGEIMIVSDAFAGNRVYRTVTSDNREELPDGSLPFFLYDGVAEYEAKCRAYKPWIEEYHVLVPGNVDGAAVVQVVDDDAEFCAPCAECPPAP